MRFIRMILRVLILGYDRLFPPKVLVQRSEVAQANLNSMTSQWSLFQLEACPFCVKVRRQMKRHAIEIPLRDIREKENHSELMSGGKLDQVPCLRYMDAQGQVHWLYESDAINLFLSQLS